MKFEERSLKIEFEEKRAFFRVNRGAQVGKSSFGSEFWRKRQRWIYCLLYASGPGIPPTFGLGRRLVRRLPSWQRPGVVSQQRLWVRRLTLVNRVPKLRFEPVSFLFLACFSIKNWVHSQLVF